MRPAESMCINALPQRLLAARRMLWPAPAAVGVLAPAQTYKRTAYRVADMSQPFLAPSTRRLTHRRALSQRQQAAAAANTDRLRRQNLSPRVWRVCEGLTQRQRDGSVAVKRRVRPLCSRLQEQQKQQGIATMCAASQATVKEVPLLMVLPGIVRGWASTPAAMAPASMTRRDHGTGRDPPAAMAMTMVQKRTSAAKRRAMWRRRRMKELSCPLRRLLRPMPKLRCRKGYVNGNYHLVSREPKETLFTIVAHHCAA